MQPEPVAVSVERVIQVVAHFFSKKPADLLKRDQHKSVAYARSVAMYLAKQKVVASTVEIGHAFGSRDDSTVNTAIRKITEARESDSLVRQHLEVLELKLAGLAGGAP